MNEFTCYVVAHLQVDPLNRFQPVVDRISFVSNKAGSMVCQVGKEIYFDLLEVSASSWISAELLAVKALMENPMLSWAYSIFISQREAE